jgi:tRNA (adenine57-N1/adenine58-N1)-methyltransferase
MYLIKGPKKLTVALGDKANTETGVMDTERLKGLLIGDEFEFSKNTFKLLKPRFIDLFHSLKRGPQIITLKDAGIIAAFAGIGPGDRIVEAGAGSGALTTFLANMVRPEGKVYSYECRDDFLKLASGNVSNCGLDAFVEFKAKDIYEGIDEKGVDVVMLDVPEPWRMLDHARGALVAGGMFICYVPTANQLIELSNQNWNGFFNIYSLEANLRYMNLKPMAVRPATTGLTHTGYLLFARKG